jgi:hypothetical protein
MGLLSKASGNNTGTALTETEASINNPALKDGVLNPSARIKEPDSFEEKIFEYHNLYGNHNLIIFENPGNGESPDDFCQKLVSLLNNTVTAFPMAAGFPIVLLPLSMDRELVAHRLSKTLNTKILLSFEAQNFENTINQINSLR